MSETEVLCLSEPGAVSAFPAGSGLRVMCHFTSDHHSANIYPVTLRAWHCSVPAFSGTAGRGGTEPTGSVRGG